MNDNRRRMQAIQEFYYKKLPRSVADEVLKLKRREQRHRAFLLYTQGKCQYCGTTENLTIDHIVPIKVTKQKRAYNLANKQLLCKKCNYEKADKIISPSD